MNTLSISHAAGSLYILGIVVMGVRAGEPDQLWWWLAMIPFAIWIASPILAGLYLRRRLPSAGAKVLFAILLAIVAVAGLALEWHTLFIGPPDAQNALVMVFVPLYQWVGVLVGLVLAWLLGKALSARRRDP